MKTLTIFGLSTLLLASSSVGMPSERIQAEYQSLEQKRRIVEELEIRYEKLADKLERDADRSAVPAMCQGRLSGTTGTPVTTADVTAIRQLRFTPYLGDKISLYYSSKWKMFTFTELTLDLNTITASVAINSNVDIFVYKANTGVITLAAGQQWTNDTTRAQALTLQDGVWVLGSNPTWRYIGTIRTDSTAANRRVIDSVTNRGIYNACNRIPRPLYSMTAANTWTYNNAAWRLAGLNTDVQVSLIQGLDEEPVQVMVKGNLMSSDANTRNASIGIGVDTTTANSAAILGGAASPSNTAATLQMARYIGHVGIGWHTLSMLENCSGCSGTNITVYGDNNVPVRVRSGIIAWNNQ